MPNAAPSLTPLLKQYFGFTSFRPLQEEIIRDALAGRDVFALLPTGGGKSLCFQLPALIGDGLTVVVSPLIALMKDQVDALTASGIAATYLNSTLTPDESRKRLRGLHNGEYRLLYAAPERLMLSGFLADLQRWNVKLIAVDEAHCISEWGHDFRPEYRQIANLRELFPGVPFMALTATATGRVREDIVNHLKLREPACFVASFNRPNLTYRVLPKHKPYDQLLAFLREHPKNSGIVYCQSRKAAESVAANLTEDGIKARPYHAGLTPQERSTNQELFLRDDIRVVCATIAFGMGINKPNVRFVIHHDLPQEHRGLLSGNRPRRARWPPPPNASSSSAPGMSSSRPASLMKNPIRRSSRSPASSCNRWFTTPRAPPAVVSSCCAISARNARRKIA